MKDFFTLLEEVSALTEKRNIKVVKGDKERMVNKNELSTYKQMGWEEVKEEVVSEKLKKSYKDMGTYSVVFRNKKGKVEAEVRADSKQKAEKQAAIRNKKVKPSEGAWEVIKTNESVELDENRLLKVSKLSSAEYQKAKKLKGFDKTNYTWNSDEQLYIKKTKNESVELDESLRKDIAQLSSKFPEGSKVRCKKSGKTGKVLTVGKDFIKVAVDGGKVMDYKPSELEPM